MFDATRASAVSITERRRPEPQGQPGFLRVDTVPRGLERGKRGVPHQRRRHGNAMASGGLHQQDQPAVPTSGAGGHPASVCLSHFGSSFRRRLGVHQPQGGGNAGETAGGVHQIAAQPELGRRPGGKQKRGGDSQAHGLWAHSQGFRPAQPSQFTPGFPKAPDAAATNSRRLLKCASRFPRGLSECLRPKTVPRCSAEPHRNRTRSSGIRDRNTS